MEPREGGLRAARLHTLLSGVLCVKGAKVSAVALKARAFEGSVNKLSFFSPSETYRSRSAHVPTPAPELDCTNVRRH